MAEPRPIPRLFVVRHGSFSLSDSYWRMTEIFAGETEWSKNG